MDVLKKLMFWKKDDLLDTGLGKSLDQPVGLEPNLGMGSQAALGVPPTQPSYPSFQSAPQGMGPQSFQGLQQEQSSYTVSKDIEIISSKLDAIRASIDNLSQRLANLERMSYGDGTQKSYGSYREMPRRPY